MKKISILTAGLLVLSLSIVPVSTAHHADDEADASAAGAYYVMIDEDDGLTIWEETNGHDGLQTSATTYEPGDDGCVGDDRQKGDVCAAPADSPVEL